MVRGPSIFSLVLLGVGWAQGAALFFNAPTPADVASTRAAWLAAIGIPSPEHFVDFESGFTDGQQLHDVSGLLPGGLVLLDTGGGTPSVLVTSGTMGGSNPVGTFAVSHDEAAYLELDFTTQAMDYVAFRDIDHTGTSMVLTFLGGATENLSLETTGFSGDSAEFAGFYRNDMPPITRIQLNAAGDGSWGIDNLEYGTLIPEPASTASLVALLVVIAVALRRRCGS